MNHYGKTAMQHWSEYAPERVAQMEDPTRFFADLGEQVAAQVEELAGQIDRQQAPSTDYLVRVGQQTAARRTAEEIVMRDLVWITDLTDEDDEIPDLEVVRARLADLEDSKDQMPTVEYEEQKQTLTALLNRYSAPRYDRRSESPG